MNLRPVTLDCDDTTPAVSVRQQPHPFEADTPDFWITTVEIGSYPNEIHLVWQTPTREQGMDMVGELANNVINGAATARISQPKAVTA
jgi:hypothetical protein